jgi:hypothetical protein
LIYAIGIVDMVTSTYKLVKVSDIYYAGCRSFSFFEALNHWGNSSDERAVFFTDAILKDL